MSGRSVITLLTDCGTADMLPAGATVRVDPHPVGPVRRTVADV
jgi:hypothetical protein